MASEQKHVFWELLQNLCAEYNAVLEQNLSLQAEIRSLRPIEIYESKCKVEMYVDDAAQVTAEGSGFDTGSTCPPGSESCRSPPHSPYTPKSPKKGLQSSASFAFSSSTAGVFGAGKVQMKKGASSAALAKDDRHHKAALGTTFGWINQDVLQQIFDFQAAVCKDMQSLLCTLQGPRGVTHTKRPSMLSKPFSTPARGVAEIGSFRISGGEFEKDKKSAKKSSSTIEKIAQLHLHEGSFVRRTLLGMIKSTRFEFFAGALILANAIFIAYQTDFEARLNNDNRDSEFELVHLVFNIVFLMELLVRFLALGMDFFVGDDRRWHAMDTLLVFFGMIEMMLSKLQFQLAQTSMLRLLRILRLVRTIRFIRTMKSIPEFQKMMYAVMGCMRTLFCSSLILGFVLYFFAIIFTSLATDKRKISEGMVDADLEEHFGTYGRTIMSLFFSVSEGISWNLVNRPLYEIDVVYSVLFMLYIFIVIFGVMNVMTSVFVESAIMSAQHYRDLIIQDKQREKEIAVRHMRAVFNQIDEDGSGEISSDEMEYFLTEPNLRKYIEALDLSADDTRMLFRLLDQDQSDVIDIEEFCDGCLRLKGNAKSIDLHTVLFYLKRFFKRWDDFVDYVEDHFESQKIHISREMSELSKSICSGSLYISSPTMRSSLRTIPQEPDENRR